MLDQVWKCEWRNRSRETLPLVARVISSRCPGLRGPCSYCPLQLIGHGGRDWGEVHGFVGKIPWRRERLPNLAFWPGEHHGLYSPWDHKELDTTETFTFTSTALWPGSGLSPVARALWLCWTLSPNCPGPPSHAPALRAWIAHGEGLCPGLTTLWRGLLTGFLLVDHDL